MFYLRLSGVCGVQVECLKKNSLFEKIGDLGLVFLFLGASYEVWYQTSFALFLFDSPISENEFKQN